MGWRLSKSCWRICSGHLSVDIIYVYMWPRRGRTFVYMLGNPFSFRLMVEVTDPAFLELRLRPTQQDQRPRENWDQQACFHCQQTDSGVVASNCILWTRHRWFKHFPKQTSQSGSVVWWCNIASHQCPSPGLSPVMHLSPGSRLQKE